jgi:hypothetical protein
VSDQQIKILPPASEMEEYRANRQKEIKEKIENAKYYVPITEAQNRYTICLSCPELNQETKFCQQCQCYAPTVVTKSYSVCPLGKWWLGTKSLTKIPPLS